MQIVLKNIQKKARHKNSFGYIFKKLPKEDIFFKCNKKKTLYKYA